MSSILLKNTSYLDENFDVKHGDIGIRNEIIDFVGDKATGEYEQTIDCSECAAMPAFVNGHAHSPMTLLKGYAENMALSDWLNKMIFPFEATMDEDDVYNSALMSVAESVRFGCVSTTDMYYRFDAMTSAYEQAGFKSNISLSVLTHNAESSMKEYIYALDRLKSLSSRIKLDVAIHAVYTSTPEVVKEFSAFAKQHGLRMHTHLSETKQENEECKAKYGITPTRYLYNLGMFDVPTTAAHCVYLEDGDREILAANNVTVAVNCTSNLKLASGIPDIAKLLKSGINVTIGTDSVSSNNNLDMFEEMKLFALLPKAVNRDPELISPTLALRAATRSGALAQGRNDCGLIKEGFKADIAVIDFNSPHLHPIHDVKNNLVYAAGGSDVRITVCDGKILYKDGEFLTLDFEKLKHWAERRIRK